jgi:adenine-specific DNA-methyltransferase
MARPNYRDLTHEQLVSLLEARDRKKFGLIWERDAIEHDRALNSDFIALDEVPELGAGEGTRANLIIEGDNFDALRALRVAYAGKVKCIYIDPPYNTGNRDFVYNDRFVEKDHNWRHSLWLEFMFQRLTLARDLLAQDGAIFVSIDDNEIFHLGLLMNEVFGEGNLLANVIWKKSYGGGSKAKHFVGLHEYVLCYAQQKDQLGSIELPPDPSVLKYYKWSDSKSETRGPYRLQPLATNSMDARPNLRFPIIYDGNEIWPEKQWQWSKERVQAALAENELVISRKKEKWSVNYKQYLKSDDGEMRGAKPYTVVDGPYTQAGTKDVKAILGDGKAFSFPKPTELIEHFLQIATDPGDLVLDFFAGSGTTGHAVLKMNAANPNQAPRRFILVSNTEATVDEPDKNLCRDVCRQRVANVISGYGEVAGTGGGFSYLRTRRIPLTRVVRRIEHAQVWLFLQLMHFGDLVADAPLASGRLHARRSQDQTVLYPTTLTQAILQRLEKECEDAANVTIYTWQPEALATRMESPGISILPIPQTLIDRFGPRP